jgi:conjugative transfer pilus assembly protein TraH
MIACKLKKYLVAAIVCMVPCNYIYADMQSDLNNYFNSVGFTSNITPPGAYEGQSAGYFTAGSMYSRAPSRIIQPVSIQSPSIKAGCNGIDLFLGGFSFLNTAELVSAAKNIGSAALGYSFYLGLKTLSPQIEDELSKLQKWMNDLNQFNKGSCEMAKFAVNSIVDTALSEDTKKCADKKQANGSASDYSEALKLCATDAKTENNDTQQNGTQAEKDNLWFQYNLAFRVLEKLEPFASDDELTELAMSITGTIVRTDPGGDTMVFRYLPPTVEKDIWAKLFDGGPVTIYDCSLGGVECLVGPGDVKTINIAISDALGTRIGDLLADIINNIKNKTPLTNDEIELIKNTRIPLYKILNVYQAYNPAMADQQIRMISEYVALDIIYEYLTSFVDEVEKGLYSASIGENEKGLMLKALDVKRAEFAKLRLQNNNRMKVAMDMVKDVRMIEQILASKISTRMATNISGSGM